MTVTATFQPVVTVRFSSTYGDGSLAYSNGSQILQSFAATDIDEAHVASGTLAASGGTVSIDLLTALDPGNNALSLAKLWAIIVLNNATAATGSTLLLGASGTDDWLGWGGSAAVPLKVAPGGQHVWTTGAGVTVDATHKIIKLLNADDGAGTIPYKIILVGKHTT